MSNAMSWMLVYLPVWVLMTAMGDRGHVRVSPTAVVSVLLTVNLLIWLVFSASFAGLSLFCDKPFCSCLSPSQQHPAFTPSGAGLVCCSPRLTGLCRLLAADTEELWSKVKEEVLFS